MKKLLLIFLALLTSAVLVACGASASHKFTTTWTSDATDHWHTCSDEGCTAVDAKATHNFASTGVTQAAVGTTAGVEGFACTVCGYAMTAPFLGMTQEEWDATFAFENVKIMVKASSNGEKSSYDLLVNGKAVQISTDSFSSFVDRDSLLSTLDFGAYYASFSTNDGITYKAETVTTENQSFANVVLELSTAGKPVTLAYDTSEKKPDPDTPGNSLDVPYSYRFTFSSWGEVTAMPPTISAEQWSNALSDATLNNYSVDVYTGSNGETTVAYYQFNGNTYYHCLGANEQISTRENAGKSVLSEIAKLQQLRADKFEYSTAGLAFGWGADTYAYSEPILSFVGGKAAVALFLCFDENALIDEMLVLLADGTELTYDFSAYGTSTPGNPSHAQGTTPTAPDA